MEPNRADAPGVPVWRQWKAQGSRAQRVDYWKDVICQAVLDAEMTLPAPRETAMFNGSIYSLNQAGARFINFRSSAHKVTRTRCQIDRNDNTYFMVGLQRYGRGLMTQAGDAVVLNPGDIGIIDSGLPFELNFPDAVDRRVVMLPKPLLRYRLKSGGPLRLESDSLISPLVGQIIHTLTERERPLSDAQVHFMLQSLADYLAGNLGLHGFPTDKQSATRDGFDTVVAYVSSNLTSSELTAASTAFAAGISLRTLHRLFSKFADCTFEQYVIKQRLSLARQRLISGAVTSVSDAAFEAGFNDLSHFTKRFSAAYGLRPSSLLRRR